MKSVIKAILGVVLIGGILMLLTSLASTQIQGPLGRNPNPPVIKKLGSYRGSTFPGFTELRVQKVKFDQAGTLNFISPEPYDLLVNINYITKVHRFEDAKETDYSCLMFFSDDPAPLLVRMPYKDVYSAVRKAADAQVK